MLGLGGPKRSITGHKKFPDRSPKMSFPRHKELLNDEYYDHTDHGNQWDYKDPRNEFGNANEKMDFEDWDKSMHKPTSRGVLSSYKKRLNLSVQDVMMKDYWD